jgi:hypothetical protein
VLSLSIPADWFVNPKTLKAFHEKYKDNEPEEIRKVSFMQGMAVGKSIKEQIGVRGDGLDSVSAVLKALLKDEPTASVTGVEKGKLILRNSGFCPLMTACTSMNLPWTWLCSVLGWPFFHGVASAVNPRVNLTMTRRRERGDPYCDHVFEIGEGKLILP